MRDEGRAVVRRMQDYIASQNGREVAPQELASLCGYSVRHCERLFRDHTGRTLAQTQRLLRLTHAARRLCTGGERVLDVALDHEYESHEGFTKAFQSAFGVSPAEYRRGGRPIPYFIPYFVDAPYKLLENGGSEMENTPVITATFSERPARKLAFLPSKNATEYWSYCQEMGCEWEGLLDSIPEKLDAPALATLPISLTPGGYASAAAAVELPADWNGTLPKDYRLADLPAGPVLYFQSRPYENEDDFCDYIDAVFAAYEEYDPQLFGYSHDTTRVPLLNFGAKTSLGARIAVPVKKI